MTLSTIIFAGPHERAVQLSARRPEALIYNAATRTFALTAVSFSTIEGSNEWRRK